VANLTELVYEHKAAQAAKEKKRKRKKKKVLENNRKESIKSLTLKFNVVSYSFIRFNSVYTTVFFSLRSSNTQCLLISVMFNLQKEAGDAEGMGAIGPDGEVSKLLCK